MEGHTEAEIRQALKELYAAPPSKQTALITAVLDEFAQIGQADREVIRGWGLEALRHLYQKMVEIGDYANAMKAIKELMRA